MTECRLEGGFDGGATLVDGTVRRVAGPWSASVNRLLGHLRDRDFAGAPRPHGLDEQGREVVTYLAGESIGSRRPWPAWTHSDVALVQVARWLRRFHQAVADFDPGADALWREGGTWRPGLLIGHHDAAPYNAVWNEDGLVGFVDWDMAGPIRLEQDVAWMAFSWVPLHARAVVEPEGFTDFGDRRRRLELFVSEYNLKEHRDGDGDGDGGRDGSVGGGGYGVAFEVGGSRGDLTADTLIKELRRSLPSKIDAMRLAARSGDATYQQMLDHGSDVLLVHALHGLDEI